jgi:hypothetical protein
MGKRSKYHIPFQRQIRKARGEKRIGVSGVGVKIERTATRTEKLKGSTLVYPGENFVSTFGVGERPVCFFNTDTPIPFSMDNLGFSF